MHKGLVALILILIPFFSEAQLSDSGDKKSNKSEKISDRMRSEEDGITPFSKGFAFGLKVINDGFGAFLEMERAKSLDKTILYQFEFATRQHKKERKLGSRVPYGNSIVYGKENFFYPVKLGVQVEQLIANKASKNGVSIKANYGGGLLLGLLRPYYAQVLDGNGGSKYVKYDSPDSTTFMDQGVLIAGPNFGKGWSDLKVTPGAYVKGGFRFDFGRFNEIISAAEVGLTGEFYSKKIPQMVYTKEDQFFLGAYVAIIFGKRK